MTDGSTGRARSGGGAGIYLTGAVVLVGAVAGLTVLSRTRRSDAQSDGAARAAELAAGPRVNVTAVGTSQSERVLRLVGEARPFVSTTLYAKISGYLREIRVDRGDRVQAGQLIAVVESPETEQQYRAAVADAQNRHAISARAHALVEPGIVSRQEADTAETGERVADAQVGVLAVQRGYRVLRAPFSGMITARYADPGALVQSATSSQTSSLPIVRVSDVDRLRVFVYLDQRDATLVHVGDVAQVSMAERPEVKVDARVTRTAGEMDPRTRTLLTEVDVDNHAGTFTAGSFVTVEMRVHAPVYPEVPTDALVMRGLDPFVAVVDAENHIRMRHVQLVDDDGAHVRVLSGVSPGEHVAVSLGDAAEDGARVQPVMQARAHGR